MVGAGIVGLSVAWFLQERGVEVAVYDADHAVSGASWGNAGWLTPALTTPLPEPDVLRYGFKTALRPSSPVFVPPRFDPYLWRFLGGFAAHCTERRWQAGMTAYAPLNRLALRAFDDLADAGATPRTRRARPFLAGFRTTKEAGAFIDHLRQIQQAGQSVYFDYLTGPQVRGAQPALSKEVDAAVLLHGQRYVHPPHFVRTLAHSVIARGGKLNEWTRIVGIDTEASAVHLVDSIGARHRHDAVVLATGAALTRLARDHGVRRLVQAGRGYSFTVLGEEIPQAPVYFPQQRVACTPLHEPADPSGVPASSHSEQTAERLRIAGMMEFRDPGEPLDPRRVRAIVDSVRGLLPGVDLEQRHDEWVGSRPCTTDGLPLIGATTSPRVFVAGGHGMWGMALGPVTGKLLAEQITSGAVPGPLQPFHPLR
ncbi:FAD-dependent oxidoreductase [Nocardioides bigeumensis]|uniref:D-amino acid dehydrogenase n=1 Tax=Nocardioides bigeumensis TaxID=433657 RepID=A0ABN2YCD6_9ACTN